MITAWEAARYQDASAYARGALEDALKSKNVGKKKKSGNFLRWPREDMPHFVLICFCFVVVNRAINMIKSNYRVINEKLSRD